MGQARAEGAVTLATQQFNDLTITEEPKHLDSKAFQRVCLEVEFDLTGTTNGGEYVRAPSA
jgi:hypothetical protein